MTIMRCAVAGRRTGLVCLLGAIILSLAAWFASAAAAEPTPDKAAPAQAEAADADGDPLIERALKPWTGDLDGMIERRMVRVLTAYNKTFYFVDRGTQRGISYELGKAFEARLNKSRKKKALKVHVVFIPAARDQLIPDLIAGRGDLAIGNLTITPERLNLVDFSDPIATGVAELVVTGPDGPPVQSPDDLAGREVVVRKSSSYFESLSRLNERFRADGKPAMTLTLADENLEDEDLLEMVNAGLYPATVVDGHEAHFWAQVFPDIHFDETVAVSTGGEIAWAMRKDSPKLLAAVNAFVKTHKIGTTFGNILLARYLKDAKYVEKAASDQERPKFQATIDLFRKYARQYDFDWLLIAAQAYQESRLNQKARSRTGAVGVMQIKPKTAASKPIGIKGVNKLENNIHAGVKYLRYLADRYFSDPAIPPLDRQLFAIAAYNAGPARIAKLREATAKRGLDPNRWFDNLEIVVADKIGRETAQYVDNIFKYYVAYKHLTEQMDARAEARDAANDGD